MTESEDSGTAPPDASQADEARPVDDEIEGLYALPLEQFVEERNALVKGLKGEGDTEASESVRRLAKPSLPAWAVNQLAHHHVESLDALVEAGERLRAAQQAGEAEEIRRCGEERRRALSAAAEVAARALEEGGHATSLATLQKIERTLETLAVYGRSGLVDPPAGRLARELEPPGFEVLATLASLPAVPSRAAAARRHATSESPASESPASESPAREKASRASADSPRVRAEEQARREAEQRARRVVQKLEEKRDRREKAVRTAESEVERERFRAAEHEAEVERLEQEVVRARRRLEAGQRQLDQRRQRLEAARRRLREVDEQLESARAEIED